jgi:hypothetical protein
MKLSTFLWIIHPGNLYNILSEGEVDIDETSFETILVLQL